VGSKCRPYAKRKAAGREDSKVQDSPVRVKLNRKVQSIVSQSCTGLKRLLKADENTSSVSRLKAPEVRSSAARFPINPTSFHVTGFELQPEISVSSSQAQWPLVDSNLSFSCYNTEVLNYRLFKEPPASVFRTKRL
jgi:hypothetical protein